MAWTAYLPDLNACLNGACTVLLVCGFAAIRKRQEKVHVRCMLAAAAVSALFLASYLTYHYLHGSTRYQGEGPLRAVYFTVLITHTIAAVVNLPMVLTTLYFAARKRWSAHRRLARWTLPLWLYVSVTGVVVYLMLYRL